MIENKKFQIRDDFSRVIDEIPNDVVQFINEDVLITGASGFVSSWLIGVWLEATSRIGGSGRLKLVCRRPIEIVNRFPHIKDNPRILLEQADVRSMTLGHDFNPTSVIHAATSASAALNRNDPMEMIDVIVSGTTNLMKALRSSDVQRVVNLSSGAVYGKTQPPKDGFHETYDGGPDITDPLNSYHEAKRLAEMIVSIEASKMSVSYVSLRLFTFLAPYLPLDTHFAAGNFLLQALRGEDIVVKSGGGSIRSYQYGSDLAKFIICALVRPIRFTVYNVGSSIPVSVSELANLIQQVVNPHGKVEIRGVDDRSNYSVYLPNTARITSEFGLSATVSLLNAVESTSQWAFLEHK